MKYCYLLIITLLSLSTAWATRTVEVRDGTIALGGNALSANEQFTLEISSAGSNVSSPHQVYVPLLNSGSTPSNADYHTTSNPSLLPNNEDDSGYFKLDSYLTLTDAGDHRLYAAVSVAGKDGTDWKLIEVYNSSGTAYSTAGAISAGTKTTAFEIFDICAIPTGAKCAGGTEPTTSSTDAIYIYVFLALESNNLSIGESINPSDDAYKGGYYLIFNFSNLYPSSAPTIKKAYQGDESISFRYTGSYSDSTDGFYAGMIGILNKGCAAGAPSPARYATVRGDSDYSFTNKDYDDYGATSGEYVFRNLENGSTYDGGIMTWNKFGFSSDIAYNTECTKAEEIQVLLEENQCYLLTAGFGRSHIVIDYFRMIRDQYLAKTFIGKMFINFYYTSAPQFTDMILKTPALAAVIRGFAWSLYFILNNILLFMASLLAFLSPFAYKRLQEKLNYGKSKQKKNQ